MIPTHAWLFDIKLGQDLQAPSVQGQGVLSQEQNGHAPGVQ